MGISKEPNVTGFRGNIEKIVVVRIDRSGRTILSAYPNMTNIKPTVVQKQQRLNFKDAQALALKMLSDPAVKAFYKEKCKGGAASAQCPYCRTDKKERPLNLYNRDMLYQVSPSSYLVRTLFVPSS